MAEDMNFDGLIAPIDLNSVRGGLQIGQPEIQQGPQVRIGEPIPVAPTMKFPIPPQGGGSLNIGMPQIQGTQSNPGATPLPAAGGPNMLNPGVSPQMGTAGLAAQSQPTGRPGVVQSGAAPQMMNIPKTSMMYDEYGNKIGGIEQRVPFNEMTPEQKTRMLREQTLRQSIPQPKSIPQQMKDAVSNIWERAMQKLNNIGFGVEFGRESEAIKGIERAERNRYRNEQVEDWKKSKEESREPTNHGTQKKVSKSVSKAQAKRIARRKAKETLAKAGMSGTAGKDRDAKQRMALKAARNAGRRVARGLKK